MTENEARLINGALERINDRLDEMDKRIDAFIKSSAEIHKISEQVNSLRHEQANMKESLKRAWGKLDEMADSIIDKEKLEAALEKITSLELAPVKKTHEAISKMKSTIWAAICGAVATGIVGFLIWLVNSFLHKTN